ncbi:hypothetical protein V1288_003750 [Bradyrhizobium sp. AZCC 2176]
MYHFHHIHAYYLWRLRTADARDYPFMSISSRLQWYGDRC